MPDNDKTRELRARLAEIVPPADDQSSARELARWFAAQFQLTWAAEMQLSGGSADFAGYRLMVAQFAAFHSLELLGRLSTELADECAAEITAGWSDSGMAEWAFEHLGEDAQAVADIADELARLTAPVAEAVSPGAEPGTAYHAADARRGGDSR